MKSPIFIIAIILLPLLTFSQDMLVKEWRTVSEFNSVNLTGNIELYLIQDSKYELTIEAEKSVMNSIVTAVNGKTLYIKPENYMKIQSAWPVKIYARMPEVRKIFLSGSGLVKSIGLNCDKLELEVYGTGSINIDELITEFLNTSAYGSGKIELDVTASNINANVTGTGHIVLTGACPQLQLNVNGTGDINAEKMENKESSAKIIGNGTIYTSASKYLSAGIYGTGNIYCNNDPETVFNSFGTGRIIKQNKTDL